MINRNQHYENLAEEILSKEPRLRLSFIKELQKRDQKFYDRMKYLAEKSVSEGGKLRSVADSEIRRILDELKP